MLDMLDIDVNTRLCSLFVIVWFSALLAGINILNVPVGGFGLIVLIIGILGFAGVFKFTDK